jgi:hypothetical protein
LKVDGTCGKCQTYQRKNLADDGKSCSSNTCGEREYLKEDGTCEECEEHTRKSADGKSCSSDLCNDT